MAADYYVAATKSYKQMKKVMTKRKSDGSSRPEREVDRLISSTIPEISV
jgi:hypothetical protein